MTDKLLSVNQLAEVLGISRSTVYRLVREDQIPHYSVGERLRFDVGEVKAALRAEGSRRGREEVTDQ
jgi:excisionase family DNA binding protein